MSLYDEFVLKLQDNGVIEKDWAMWGYPDRNRVVDLNCHEFSESGETGFIVRSSIDSFEVDTIAKDFNELLFKLDEEVNY